MILAKIGIFGKDKLTKLGKVYWEIWERYRICLGKLGVFGKAWCIWESLLYLGKLAENFGKELVKNLGKM